MKTYPDRLSPNQDAFYHSLMEIHEDLDEAASQALNARLILLMANQIGDIDTLTEIMHTARAYAND